MVGLIVDIKFAVCYFVILSIILSVCLARVSSETAERIWLKVCTKTKVCPRHYTTLRILMKINCPRGPAMGAEMFFFSGRLPSSFIAFVRRRLPLATFVSYSFARCQHNCVNTMGKTLCQCCTCFLLHQNGNAQQNTSTAVCVAFVVRV